MSTELKALVEKFEQVKKDLNPHNWDTLQSFGSDMQRYKDEFYTFKVRDKELKIATHSESLSHNQIPKISTPKYRSWGDVLNWTLQENVPGQFPYTAGFSHSKEKGKTQHACLPVKVVQSAPTADFTM